MYLKDYEQGNCKQVYTFDHALNTLADIANSEAPTYRMKSRLFLDANSGSTSHDVPLLSGSSVCLHKRLRL